MTEFEKDVAQAAVAAIPAPLGPQQTENVVEQLRRIESSKVEKTISELVKRGVLVCQNTLPPDDATFGSQTFGSQPFGGFPPVPPTFFKYTKGPHWED
jgi:hypothetical protein